MYNIQVPIQPKQLASSVQILRIFNARTYADPNIVQPRLHLVTIQEKTAPTIHNERDQSKQ
jgi:hypothetical protein